MLIAKQKKILIIVDPKNFDQQKDAIATALREIDPDSYKTLEKFIYRLGELGLLRIIKL